jgi:molybdenum cofactor cytidylyltransferase
MITINSRTQPTLRVIVLAAGLATRLGQPKALARVRGATLLERLIATLRPLVSGAGSTLASAAFASASAILVIAPPRAAPFRQARSRLGASPTRVNIVPNPLRADGLSSSVRLGLRHARYSAAALLIPVDLIDLSCRDVARLVRRWQGSRRRVVASAVAGAASTPLILPHWLFGQACSLTGDQGLRGVVRKLGPSRMTLLRMPSAASDIDTPGDLRRARRCFRGYPRGVCTKR